MKTLTNVVIVTFQNLLGGREILPDLVTVVGRSGASPMSGSGEGERLPRRCLRSLSGVGGGLRSDRSGVGSGELAGFSLSTETDCRDPFWFIIKTFSPLSSTANGPP